MGTRKRTESIIGPVTFAYAYETTQRKDGTLSHLNKYIIFCNSLFHRSKPLHGYNKNILLYSIQFFLSVLSIYDLYFYIIF